MKRVILLSIILIFLITGMGFAFQNEPDGFRGLKWGDAPTEDMTFYYQTLSERLGKGNIYHKLHNKPYIGNVKLDSIDYTFNLRSNQFYKVSTFFYDENNFNILKVIFKDKFGEPTEEERYFLYWRGNKTYIHIFFNPEGNGKGYGHLLIQSMKICSENPPEINEQEEVEKAKDDF